MDPTLACGVFGLGVKPGEGKGEALIPGITAVVVTGWAGKVPPPVSVLEVATGPQRCSRVHWREEEEWRERTVFVTAGNY